ncbi:plant intracellular Ras-group-related LRR protein 3-like [Cucurbita moschata]|uniref:Plant intracellular Ras-group-related LRR protein 3-like n=1 Tax=Cucurbita moschata TaxID=3662 RepID=A0A6J1G0C5_CUCMO|nr:plant intracellular Ras-group-related LRR protein 3-like [Cucurbita moschata]
MDSLPDSISDHFPILYYVLYQLDSISGTSNLKLSPKTKQSVLTQLSHLNNPKVLASMIEVIPDNLTNTLSALISLGPPPDPSAIAAAHEKIIEIQSGLQKSLQEMEAEGIDDLVERQNKLRKAAEKETQIYKMVDRVVEIHEAYKKQLSSAEDRLVEVYESAAAELEKETDLDVNEEIIRILKEAESGVVEKVDLFGQQIKFLPEGFGKLRRLIELNLSNNQLKVLPDSIAGLQKLERLDISSNLLESIPDSIGLLVNLKVMNVTGNKLYTLPETLTGCSSLVELDASFNDLRSLPINIGYGLINLERLSIQLNKICYLPASICQLKSLRYFDAHFNQLHALPPDIGRLTNLEVLILSGNFYNFTEVPESICDLCNLRELDLSDNQIRALPDRFGRLEKLLKLNMDQNPLVIPPMTIVDKGSQAVKDYMDMRWADLVAEKQKAMHEANMPRDQIGWFARGSSMFSNITSGVVQTISDYTGGRTETHKNPWLYQQL